MKLITQPRAGTSYNEILSLHFAARELGWEVIPAPYGWRLENKIERGIPYGSQIFCEVIVHQTGWKLLSNPFDWLANLPEKYTKRHIEFMILKDAKNIKTTKFIKPADDKCFDAKVYDSGTFSPPDILPDETPCLISDIVSFDAEYRCFVKDNKVVTSSCYIYKNEIAQPQNWYKYDLAEEHPESFVNRMLESIPVVVNSVIDVGVLSSTKKLAIIESNPIWASGLYGCDPLECLKAMEGSVQYE